MKSVSLFAGAGGFDVGASRVGIESTVLSELDPHACMTLRKNFPSGHIIEGDIDTEIENIAALGAGAEIVFGGPPCQGFSVAGYMDPDDPRSKLVFSFCDVVEKIDPQCFVMENVKSLGTLSKFEGVRNRIFERADKAGFNVDLVVLNSSDYGVPQSRERVFFIGIKKEIGAFNRGYLDTRRKPLVTIGDAIRHLGPAGSQGNPNKTKARITLAENPVMRKSPYSGMLFNGQGRPLNPERPSATLPASMGGNRTPIVDELQLYNGAKGWVEEYHAQLIKTSIKPQYKEAPSRLRRLTIDECRIIQDFPDDYKFSGSSSRVFCQIGNAVPCGLAEAVLGAVKDTVNISASKARTKWQPNLFAA